MNNDFNYLSDDDRKKIVEIFEGGTLDYKETDRDLIFNGVMPKFFTGLRVIDDFPIKQLESDLEALSQTPALLNNTIPLVIWLKNLSNWLKAFPVQNDIEAILERVKKISLTIKNIGGNQPPPPTNADRLEDFFTKVAVIADEVVINPFLGVASYSIQNSEIFSGRGLEKKMLLDRIVKEKKSIVLVGEPFIGKTSLIDAAVIPGLVGRENKTYLALKVKDYEDFFKQMARAVDVLPVNYEQNFLNGSLVRDISLPTVIIFDRFETVCDLIRNPAEETLFVESLERILNKNLQVIIAVRPNTSARGIIAKLAAKNADKLYRYEELEEFSDAAAKDIVLDLLSKQTNVKWSGEDVIMKLAVDCSQLGRNDGKVNPQLLQIVCREIYEAAERAGRKIDADFYESLPAKTLLTRHLERVLKNNLLTKTPAVAYDVLLFLGTTGTEYSATFQQIKNWLSQNEGKIRQNPEAGSNDEIIEEVLTDLERVKLIFKQPVGDDTKYFATFPFYADKAAELNKENSELYDTLLLRQDFHYSWLMWQKDGALITADRLQRFTRSKDKLKATTVQTLFLLRSAINTNQSVFEWLEELKKNKGAALVKDLQKLSPANRNPVDSDFINLDSAIKLFGESTAAAGAGNEATGSGWLVRKAVTAAALEDRQAAILVLTLEEKRPFLLKNVVTPEVCPGGWERLKRRGELAATLLDFCPESKIEELKMPLPDRLLGWIWKHILKLQRTEISGLQFSVINALIAGLFFGVSRVLFSFNPFDNIGRTGEKSDNYILYSIVFSIVGGVAVFAFSMITTLVKKALAKNADRESAPSSSSPKPYSQTVIDFSIIAAGALVFGIWQLITTLFSLRENNWWSLALGAAAGFGLGFGLKVSGSFPASRKAYGLIAGAVVTALFFFLAQLIGSRINRDLTLFYAVSNLGTTFAVIDAVFEGLIFYLAISAGIYVVENSAQKSKILFG